MKRILVEQRSLALFFFVYYLGLLAYGVATGAEQAIFYALFFVGLGLGAINETIEFLITRLPGDSNVGGFSNTGWDLVANTLGAATAALFASRSRARIEAAP